MANGEHGDRIEKVEEKTDRVLETLGRIEGRMDNQIHRIEILERRADRHGVETDQNRISIAELDSKVNISFKTMKVVGAVLVGIFIFVQALPALKSFFSN